MPVLLRLTRLVRYAMCIVLQHDKSVHESTKDFCQMDTSSIDRWTKNKEGVQTDKQLLNIFQSSTKGNLQTVLLVTRHRCTSLNQLGKLKTVNSIWLSKQSRRPVVAIRTMSTKRSFMLCYIFLI